MSEVAVEAGEEGVRRNSTLAEAIASPFSSAIFPETLTSSSAAQAIHKASVGPKIMERNRGRICPLPGDSSFIVQAKQPSRPKRRI